LSINIPCLKNGIKNKLFRQTNYKNGCPYLNTLVSGSPIIQNDKLVGVRRLQRAKRSRITHVMINDPTVGYGIFIENMLNQMRDLAR